MRYQFEIFTYAFVRTAGLGLFGEAAASEVDPQALLATYLQSPVMTLVSEGTRRRKAVSYANQTHRDYGGIKLMSVDNSRDVAIYRRHRKETEVSNPFCYIIIDNRPGRAHIAIQNGAEAFRIKPSKMAGILQHSINGSCLARRGWNIEIRPVRVAGGFWDAVEHKRSAGVSVRRVTFDFPNPRRVKTPSATQEQQRYLDNVARTVVVQAAAKIRHVYEAEGRGGIELDRNEGTLRSMVSLCYTTGYSVAATFSDKQTYRSGSDMTLRLELDDGSLDNFIGGQQTLEARPALVGWLDGITEAEGV